MEARDQRSAKRHFWHAMPGQFKQWDRDGGADKIPARSWLLSGLGLRPCQALPDADVTAILLREKDFTPGLTRLARTAGPWLQVIFDILRAGIARGSCGRSPIAGIDIHIASEIGHKAGHPVTPLA
jgi:hypothetical protein